MSPRNVLSAEQPPEDMLSTMPLDQNLDSGHLPDLEMWPMSEFNADAFELPSFFEHIMVDHFAVPSGPTQMPPSISNMMPDKDWFGETDLFGLNFEALESSAYSFPEGPREAKAAESALETPADAEKTGNVSGRQAIFERSPWLWNPGNNQNAFSEHNAIPLDERDIDMAASPHQPFLPSLAMHDQLSAQTRDKIFQLVIKTAHSDIAIPSFPSASCLDVLLKVGIAKRAETDAWIHPYTFNSETTRPELLTALIAAGCVCFGIPSVSKTGLVLFEVARVALTRLSEEDNSVIRDLQYLQASMMWIDICAFCGFKRKQEIAESNLQPLVTALRRFGKFDRVAYSSIMPTHSDDGEALDRKWKQWVEQESFKRLVHHVFEHDIYTTVAKVRNPLVSYAEMTLPLPASRDLWLAPSPEAWKAAYLEKTDHGIWSSLSARDLLADSELVKCLPSDVDADAAKRLQLYGLAALSWEYHQQTSLCTSPHANVEPSAKLWMDSRYRHLYDTLLKTRKTLHEAAAVTRVFREFLLMSLHVNPDHVTRFAGKAGEDEAHRAYQELHRWVQTKEARTSVWHAAQVLRAARAVPPFQLRGSDAFIIHHAVMVLWAFSMLRRDAARRTGTATPANDGHRSTSLANGFNTSPARLQPVVLDEISTADVDSFIIMDAGRPCLTMVSRQENPAGRREQHRTQSCDLRNPQMVMAVGVQVLEGNYPNEAREKLPQLIKSLCDLMSELGSLR